MVKKLKHEIPQSVLDFMHDPEPEDMKPEYLKKMQSYICRKFFSIAIFFITPSDCYKQTGSNEVFFCLSNIKREQPLSLFFLD